MDNFQGFNKVDVTLSRITSLVTNSTVDVRRMTTLIELYGSIFDPTFVGIIYINDTTSTLYNMPVCGEEILELEFKTNGNETPFEKTFYVFKVEDVSFDPNGSSSTMKLHFISLSQIPAIGSSLAYGTKQQISQSVEDILRNKVKISDDVQLNIEETQGIEHLVFQNWNAWDTIEFLRQRAVSTKYSSPYFFFEDSKGFNFVSCEELIDQRKKAKEVVTYTSEPFSPESGEGATKSTVLEKQRRNVENLTILKKSNTTDSINQGGVSNSVRVFSLLSKTMTTIDKTSDEIPDMVKQPLDDKFNRTRSSTLLKVVDQGLINFLVPVDATNNSSFVTNVGVRRMFNKMFGDIKLGFTMYGDSSLEPGDVIRLEIPKTVGSTEEDPQLTGNYMVTNFVHRIRDDEMMTSVEVYKFGYGQEVV